jgi:outer membrane lipoprotein LolB
MIALIGACAREPLLRDSVQLRAWKQHQSLLLQLKDWKIQGRVGLYTPDEAWPGDIHWSQSEQNYDMRIIAPLGAGSLHIYTVDGGVMLEHSSEPMAQFSADPEALIEQKFGWQLPVNSLRYWMTGVPSPHGKLSAEMDLDEKGRLISLQQSGWNIQFSNYKNVSGYELPAKVLLEHKDLSVKIVIRKWQI